MTEVETRTCGNLEHTRHPDTHRYGYAIVVVAFHHKHNSITCRTVVGIGKLRSCKFLYKTSRRRRKTPCVGIGARTGVQFLHSKRHRCIQTDIGIIVTVISQMQRERVAILINIECVKLAAVQVVCRHRPGYIAYDGATHTVGSGNRKRSAACCRRCTRERAVAV